MAISSKAVATSADPNIRKLVTPPKPTKAVVSVPATNIKEVVKKSTVMSKTPAKTNVKVAPAKPVAVTKTAPATQVKSVLAKPIVSVAKRAPATQVTTPVVKHTIAQKTTPTVPTAITTKK